MICYFYAKNVGKRFILLIGIACFGIIFPASTLAQENPFHNITVETGLPYFAGSGSYGILQDSRGYIWLATNDGLCRYDGQSFRVFRKNTRSEAGIANDFIICVAEDLNGHIWVGTAFGISVLDPSTGLFRQYLSDPKDPNSLIANEINFIKRDFEGNMWIGTRYSGICYFDWKKKFFSRFPRIVNKTGLVKGIRDGVSFAQLPDSSIWIGNTDGLHRILPEKMESQLFVPFKEHTGAWWYIGVFEMAADAQGKLWVSSRMPLGRRRFDPQKSIFEDIPAGVLPDPSQSITTVFCDRKGYIWFGTNDGAVRYDAAHQSTKLYRHNPLDATSILPGRIDQIYEDREGNIWFLASSVGYSVLRQETNPFQKCTDFGSSAIMPANDRQLFLTRDKGIALFDLERNNIVPDDLPPLIQSDMIGYFLVTRRRELWASYPLQSFSLRYDLDNRSIARYDHVVKPLAEDTRGNVWMSHALNRIDSVTGKLINVMEGLPEPDRALMNSIDFKVIACDSTGHIWIGSDGQGLYRYDIASNRLASCERGLPTLKSLRDAIIYGIGFTSKGLMYASTTYGLCLYDPVREKMHLLDERHGLPSRRVFAIVEDLQGKLWLATVKGISCLDPQTLRVINFDESNGLEADAFIENAAYRDARGFLYFSSQNNLIRFHPDSLVTTRAVAPVCLNQFYLDHRPVELIGQDSVLHRQVFGSKQVHLRYHQNNFGFAFVMPVIRDADKVQYYYQLEGYDDGWKTTGNQREIHYTNIDPGSYTFRARAVNGAGLPCTADLVIPILITPPWWATWWAYTFYGLLVVGLIYIIFSRQRLQYKLNLETLESEKLKEVDQLKSRFFANISHEFRTPLTLILGEIDSLKAKIFDQRERGQLDVAGRNARRLLELINQLLDLSKLEAHSMALQAVEKDIVPFLKNIFFSMQLLADQKQIRLVFEAAPTPVSLYFDPDKLEKIFSNLLSNAWKFTPSGGTIALSIAAEINGAAIRVTDTGIGIPAQSLPMLFDRFYQVDSSATRRQQGTGIGLALVKELVELHHGEVTVESEPGQGTTFRVFLPAGRAHLTDAQILPASEFITGTDDAGQWWIGALEAQSNSADVVPEEGVRSEQKSSVVLVVEDNPDVRVFISDNLSAAGHRVVQASHGRMGLDKAREHLPDLIVTDIMMPEMDGIEMCRQLHSDILTSHIPVIILTARSGEEEKIEGLRTGVDDYLTKPFSARELLLRVANLIAIRRELRKRFSTALVIRPEEVSSESTDQVFLKKVIKAITDHMSDEQFGIEPLSEILLMSATHLNRKLNALIGQSAGHLIRSMRLQRAADLLQKNAGSVSEIAYAVGFGAPESFARSFKKQFQCTPQEYQKKAGE